MWQEITETAKKHKKPERNFTYGTAGFRQRADELDSVVFRVGILAALRSKAKNGKTIGVMITASHNPVQDNGVKLIDPWGEMLEESWEKHATKLANASDECLVDTLKEIVSSCNIDMNAEVNVFIARDTRPSGEELSLAIKDGIASVKGRCLDFGMLTTPQLHFIVRCVNSDRKYGKPSEEGYYTKLSNAFNRLMSQSADSPFGSLKIDGANGIGGSKVKEMLKYTNIGESVTIYNDGRTGVLNEKCGADFVKVQQAAPIGFVYESSDRCVSFDGDADRVVYFYKDGDGVFNLLDGDKIATLIAAYLKEKLDIANIQLKNGLGVIQTSYANGSSTEYLTNSMKVPVACAKTGVKHLHHKAQDYDIGVYFEANGHGTVLFSDEAESRIKQAASDDSDATRHKAAVTLSYFLDLTNQTVGDAISDMLLVESILYEKKWTCADWNKCYRDLPNKQSKVKVKDRTVIQTTDAERRVSSPAELQEGIDGLVKNVSKGRSFVRPSGTEDVVRVYAESETKENTEYLSKAVSQLVFDLCGGAGDEYTSSQNGGSKRKFCN